MGLFYLTDTYRKMETVGFIVGGAVLVTAAAVIPWAVITTNNNTKKALGELNTKIERDLGVDSFSANSVVFDSTVENYVIKITGSAKDISYLSASYKVSEQDFYDLKLNKDDVVKIKSSGVQFIEQIVEVLNQSELIREDMEDLALTENDEAVLNLSKPYLNEDTGLVNYNLTIAKLHGKDLKLGSYVVSAPMSEEIIKNPESIYLLSGDQVQIEKVDEGTYKDVMHVEMLDDCTIIM